MSEQPEPLEDIAANLLTGVMVILIGAAIPTLFVWMAASGRVDWNVGLDLDSLVAANTVVCGSIFSFFSMRSGLRIIRKGVTALRGRRSSIPTG
ncbi:MAG: hypothetical protein KKE52_12250 [Alphaproteobacteria bacterium]|nr:hypothetical protein [Alphaproteobacteria bacterium]MBU2272060.1 hypothetical protein [Alphaproteobacteria bacterium]